MTIDELYTQIAKDFDLDPTDVIRETAKISELFVKYLKQYSEESLRLDAIETKRKELVIKKRDYYSGNGTPEEYKLKPFGLKLKTEQAVNKYIESDSDVILYDQKLLIQKQKVSILKECLEAVKRRNFEIKNIIDYLKFSNGL